MNSTKPSSTWKRNTFGSPEDSEDRPDRKQKMLANSQDTSEERPTVDMLIELGKRMSHMEDQLEQLNEQLKLASDTIKRKDSEIELLKSQLIHENSQDWPSDPELMFPGTNSYLPNEKNNRAKNTNPVIKLPEYIPVNPLEKNKSDKRPGIISSNDDIYQRNKIPKYKKGPSSGNADKAPSITSYESLTDILKEQEEIEKNNRSDKKSFTNNNLGITEDQLNQNDDLTEYKKIEANRVGSNILNKYLSPKPSQNEDEHLISTDIPGKIVQKSHIKRTYPNRKLKEKTKTVEVNDNLRNAIEYEKRSELIGKTASEFSNYLAQRKLEELGSTSTVDEAFNDVCSELNDRCKRFVKKFALLKEKMEESSLYGSRSTSVDSSVSSNTEIEDSAKLGKLIVVITELNERATRDAARNQPVNDDRINGKEIVNLALYADGMQVEGRPFKKYATPSVEEFFLSLKAGYYPNNMNSSDSKKSFFKILDFRSQTYVESQKNPKKSARNGK